MASATWAFPGCVKTSWPVPLSGGGGCCPYRWSPLDRAGGGAACGCSGPDVAPIAAEDGGGAVYWCDVPGGGGAAY
eukprot:67482-Prorocentrum_minimum.AAC.1